MNAKEVAKFLNLHPNTVYTMIREGEIKAFKKGRSYEIPEEEVERLLNESKTVDRSTDKRMAVQELILDINLEIEENLNKIHKINTTVNTQNQTGDRHNQVVKMVEYAEEIARLENLKRELEKKTGD